MTPRKRKKPRIDARSWYSARETARLLDDEINELTVKQYCKKHKIRGQQRGPLKAWRVLGSEITRLRKKWKLDA